MRAGRKSHVINYSDDKNFIDVIPATSQPLGGKDIFAFQCVSRRKSSSLMLVTQISQL
jgi:hypothetical protein